MTPIVWRGQDNFGNSINIIYYGNVFIPSFCIWIIPGTLIEEMQ